MENKTPVLTKLIIIIESLLLIASLTVFYFLKGAMKLSDNLQWFWIALMVFSVASFLFFLIVFIIALIKKSLRVTHWVPVSFIPCIIFLVLTLLMVIGPSVMHGTSIERVEAVPSTTTEAEKAETSTTTPTEETKEKAETNIFKIGDTFKIGDLQFTINSVRTSETDERSHKPSEKDYVFLFIDTTIENLGSEEVYVNPYNNFRLVDKNGRNYNLNLDVIGKGSIEGILAPGRKISGEQIYNIPKDIKEYEVEVFNRGLSESEVVIVEISISQ